VDLNSEYRQAADRGSVVDEGPLGELIAAADQERTAEGFEQSVHVIGLVGGGPQELRGAAGMTADAVGVSFARLDAGGGQFDEALYQCCQGAGSPRRVPKPFPRFVRFPIVAVVKKKNAASKLARLPGVFGVKRLDRQGDAGPGMAARVARGMGMAPWNVGVRREQVVGYGVH
jgi:hypothetical protein